MLANGQMQTYDEGLAEVPGASDAGLLLERGGERRTIRLSHTPLDSFAKVFADRGQIRRTSAHFLN